MNDLDIWMESYKASWTDSDISIRLSNQTDDEYLENIMNYRWYANDFNTFRLPTVLIGNFHEKSVVKEPL